MTDEQIGPERGNPVTKALRAMRAEIRNLQDEVDTLMGFVNAHDARIDAHYEAFLRHTHGTGPDVENAVNAKESRQERERHA